MRRFPLVVVGVALACGAVGVLGFLYVQHRDGSANATFLTSRPLVQNLPGDDASASAEMEARLRRSFPAGTSTASLRAYLANQGFEIHSAEGKPEAYTATLSRLGNLADLARRDWYVSWREDQTGHLLALTASQFVQMS